MPGPRPPEGVAVPPARQVARVHTVVESEVDNRQPSQELNMIDIARALDKTDRSGIIHGDCEDALLGDDGECAGCVSTPPGVVVVQHWFEDLREPAVARVLKSWAGRSGHPRRDDP